MNNGALYHSLDVQITLRCNAACQNCIKFCNSKSITGLDYSTTDMTFNHISALLCDVANIGGKVFDIVCVTGGEPFVHPDAVQMILTLERWLLNEGHCNKLIVNTNQLIKAPESVQKFLALGVKPKNAWTQHNCAYLHPDDMHDSRPTYAGCTHYRKHNLVYNTAGYFPCCAGDGYARLFRLNELFIPRLPRRLEDFPLDKMNAVCCHCPFGCKVEFFERDIGRPVSKIYQEQGEINKNAKLS